MLEILPVGRRQASCVRLKKLAFHWVLVSISAYSSNVTISFNFFFFTNPHDYENLIFFPWLATIPILCFSFNLLFASHDGCNVPAEPLSAGL